MKRHEFMKPKPEKEIKVGDGMSIDATTGEFSFPKSGEYEIAYATNTITGTTTFFELESMRIEEMGVDPVVRDRLEEVTIQMREMRNEMRQLRRDISQSPPFLRRDL